jgi:hypothetical protein
MLTWEGLQGRETRRDGIQGKGTGKRKEERRVALEYIVHNGAQKRRTCRMLHGARCGGGKWDERVGKVGEFVWDKLATRRAT